MTWSTMTRAERLMLLGFGLIHLGVIVSGVAALVVKPWRTT